MWGSTFAEIARKAQELQDQAASTVSSQASGLFNLDAMQNMTTSSSSSSPAPTSDKDNIGGTAFPNDEDNDARKFSSSSSSPATPSLLADEIKRPPPAVPPPIIHEEQPTTRPRVDNECVTTATKGKEEEEEESNDDDDDERLPEPPHPPLSNTFEQHHPPMDGTTSTIRESKEGRDEKWEDEQNDGVESAITVKEDHVVDDVNQNDSNFRLDGAADDDAAVTPAAVETTTKEKDEAFVGAAAAANEQGLASPPPSSAEDERNKPATSPVKPPMMIPDTTVPTTPVAAATTTHDSDGGGRKKLIVLISPMPINRQVSTQQDLALTVLTSNEIDYEVLDGVEEKELRNELFALSGRRGAYPQFFIVNLAAGGTTFWGGWDEFQQAHENNYIRQVFPMKMTTTSLLLASPDSNVAINNTPMSKTTATTAAAPDNNETLLRSFAEQIKRIEDNHQAERTQLDQEHARALAAHLQTYETQRQEMETRFGQQILAKDGQIAELCRRNEGYRLKLDVLQREVTGTQEILQRKDHTAGKVSQQHLNELRSMEKKLVLAETQTTQLNEQVQQLQGTLTGVRNELTTARNEHAELKERAKLVATELKERRMECRELHGKMEDMGAEHDRLQREIETLKDQLSHQGLNQSEKDGEMDSLRNQLARAQEVHKTAEREWKDREVKHEQALSDYKKKAQHSLSMANSRTAAAVQAREEAELDARAARSTADSAFERATAAELSSREAVAEAKAALRVMERERDETRAKMTELMEAKTRVDVELAAVQAKLNLVVASRDKQGIELEAMRADLRAEQSQSASLQHQIIEIEAIKKKYQAEIDSLNIQLEGTKRALEAVDKGRDSTSEVYSVNAETFSQRSDDGAVTALRQELREANDSIQYLKDALKNAVEMNEKSAGQSNGGGGSHPEYSEEQNDGIPLFYAMEKQAELKTARAEINRLANELANLQSDKSEAVESMNEMRQRMEESEARLKRFEKLSGTDDTGVPTSQNGNTPAQANRAVNIEYLKHIMLKYITAKTTTERKALVPVIGAVLELTSTELTKALASVEQTASASSSFFGLM